MRHPFGQMVSDYVIGSVDASAVLPGQTAMATFKAGAVVTFWNAAVGGTQVVDLTTDSEGLQGIAGGSVQADVFGALSSTFFGPDGVVSMWADASAAHTGPRVLIVARDVPDMAVAAAASAQAASDASTRALTAAQAASDAASSALARALINLPVVQWDPVAQAWPPRPVGVDGIVLWIGGPTRPPVGNGYASNTDYRFTS